MIEAWLEIGSLCVRPLSAIVLIVSIIFFGKRLLLPAILALFAGLHLLVWGPDKPFPTPSMIWGVALMAALLSAGIRRLDFSCVAGSAGVLALGVLSLAKPTFMAPFAGIAFLTWLGAWSAVLFPKHRMGLVTLCLLSLLILGGVQIFESTPLALWYFGISAVAIALGWRFRERVIMSAGILGVLLIPIANGRTWMPHSDLGWGIMALAVGFAALAGGFSINLSTSRYKIKPCNSGSSAEPGGESPT